MNTKPSNRHNPEPVNKPYDIAERRPKRSPERDRLPLPKTNINCQHPKHALQKHADRA